MSAIAFIIKRDKAHLYSDGRSWSDAGPAKDDRQKIHKINSHTAMIHAGAWREGVLEQIISEAGRADNLQELTSISAHVMFMGMGDVDYETLTDNPHENSALWILSYEQGEPELYFIEGKKNFEPKPIPVDTNLLIGAMVYGADRPPFQKYLEEYYGKNKDFKLAGYQAFGRMVMEYQHTGRVNLNVYYEEVENPTILVLKGVSKTTK